MIYLGNSPVGVGLKSGPIPTFFNDVEYGNFTLESGSSIWVSLSRITDPKGILVYNDTFDVQSAKDDKPVLGAYAAIAIVEASSIESEASGYKQVSSFATYAVNWGTAVGNYNYPAWRSSRTETRGIRFYDQVQNRFHVVGFGTGDYDFKLNTTYHWMAWE